MGMLANFRVSNHAEESHAVNLRFQRRAAMLTIAQIVWHLYASWVTIIASYAWLPLVLASSDLKKFGTFSEIRERRLLKDVF
jgi:hypothetical protein